jgi:hypothetical protein
VWHSTAGLDFDRANRYDTGLLIDRFGCIAAV